MLKTKYPWYMYLRYPLLLWLRLGLPANPKRWGRFQKVPLGCEVAGKRGAGYIYVHHLDGAAAGELVCWAQEDAQDQDTFGILKVKLSPGVFSGEMIFEIDEYTNLKPHLYASVVPCGYVVDGGIRVKYVDTHSTGWKLVELPDGETILVPEECLSPESKPS